MISHTTRLTMIGGKDIVRCVEAQHWHLHRLHIVNGARVSVVVVIGWITEHDGCETFIKLSDCFSLRNTSNNTKYYINSM